LYCKSSVNHVIAGPYEAQAIRRFLSLRAFFAWQSRLPRRFAPRNDNTGFTEGLQRMGEKISPFEKGG